MVDIISIYMGDIIGHGLWFMDDILPRRLGPRTLPIFLCQKGSFSFNFLLETHHFGQKTSFIQPKSLFLIKKTVYIIFSRNVR